MTARLRSSTELRRASATAEPSTGSSHQQSARSAIDAVNQGDLLPPKRKTESHPGSREFDYFELPLFDLYLNH